MRPTCCCSISASTPDQAPLQRLANFFRNWFAAAPGAALSEVRIHRDSGRQPNPRARSPADAYIRKRDIYFATGQYAPNSPQGWPVANTLGNNNQFNSKIQDLKRAIRKFFNQLDAQQSTGKSVTTAPGGSATRHRRALRLKEL